MLSNKNRERLYDTLQELLDEGWDMGVKYAEVKDANSDVKMHYWEHAEEYEQRLVETALSRIEDLFSDEN